MSRLIDKDALMDGLMERYCKECNKRRGIKNGKYRIIYEIGEVPCRACEIDDVKAELEEAPAVDAVEVVRCLNCEYWYPEEDGEYGHCRKHDLWGSGTWYCADGERRKDGEQ